MLKRKNLTKSLQITTRRKMQMMTKMNGLLHIMDLRMMVQTIVEKIEEVVEEAEEEEEAIIEEAEMVKGLTLRKGKIEATQMKKVIGFLTEVEEEIEAEEAVEEEEIDVEDVEEEAEEVEKVVRVEMVK